MTETGLRERKKADTRAALAAATLRLAEEHGFDTVTVEQVAAAADVSYRTFFNHFASKEEALLQPDGAGPGLAELLRAQDPAQPTMAAARAALQQALARVEDDGDAWLRRLEVIAASRTLLPRLVELGAADEAALAAVVAERTGQDPVADLHPPLLAATLGTALRVTVWRWHTQGGRTPLAALLDEVLDALAAGLPDPPA